MHEPAAPVRGAGLPVPGGEMSECRRCAARGKVWNGDDPVCGFHADGTFNPDNWNCATLNALRTEMDRHQRAHQSGMQESIGTLPVEASINGHIVLSWYKNRGRVTGALFLAEDGVSQALTLEYAEAAL